jgi:glycosyltransferase involved in cell wall biosynthesis
MSSFIIFTRTAWSEAPRLRHQVTQLLLDAGHRVHFFELPRPVLSRETPRATVTGVAPAFVRTTHLIHHQLRVVPPLHGINAWFVRRQIESFLRTLPSDEVTVINFNYDYYFLRKLFPKQRIVTIINDDFEAQSRLPIFSHITWALRRTCSMSDAVFAVSVPLVRRLSQWSDAALFLPWSAMQYAAPQTDVAMRTQLLFWGYIDERLDIDMLNRVAADLARRGPQWELMLVGPTQGRGRDVVERAMARHTNVRILESHRLDQLSLDTIIAAVIPYLTPSAMDAVTLPNKAMQLLAHGLPLLISGMPAFIEAPFVRRLDGEESPATVIDSCIADFNALQPTIAKFLGENTPQSRLKQLGLHQA